LGDVLIGFRIPPRFGDDNETRFGASTQVRTARQIDIFRGPRIRATGTSDKDKTTSPAEAGLVSMRRIGFGPGALSLQIESCARSFLMRDLVFLMRDLVQSLQLFGIMR
jgi:hypothetical protein